MPRYTIELNSSTGCWLVIDTSSSCCVASGLTDTQSAKLAWRLNLRSAWGV